MAECIVSFMKKHISEVDVQDLMFLIATFLIDRRDKKKMHDSIIDVLCVSRKWMRGFDHLYKKIRPVSISCHLSFNAPELMKSKYDDWDVDDKTIKPDSKQHSIMVRNLYLKKRSQIPHGEGFKVCNPYLKKKNCPVMLGKQDYDEMVQMCFSCNPVE